MATGLLGRACVCECVSEQDMGWDGGESRVLAVQPSILIRS